MIIIYAVMSDYGDEGSEVMRMATTEFLAQTYIDLLRKAGGSGSYYIDEHELSDTVADYSDEMIALNKFHLNRVFSSDKPKITKARHDTFSAH
jgi:hypothetical protein